MRLLSSCRALCVAMCLLPVSSLPACSDNPDDDADTADTGRPSRDVGEAADTGDAQNDAGANPEIPPFNEGWAAYRAAVEQNARQACSCELTWAFLGGSQEACESQIVSELAQQLDCLQGALLTSEAQARGWVVCAVGPVNEANACFSAIADPGCDETGCAIDEAATADCDLLLTEDQKIQIQICQNTSSN